MIKTDNEEIVKPEAVFKKKSCIVSKNAITMISLLIMLGIFSAFIVAITSCTYSVSQIHTEGQASDVVDETQSATPNIAPTLKIPVKPI